MKNKKKKNNKESKYDSLLGKNVVIYDADKFKEDCKIVADKIIDELTNEYGIEVPYEFSDYITLIMDNNIGGIFSSDYSTAYIDGIITLPYNKFAGKIDIETARDFDILSESLKLASELK